MPHDIKQVDAFASKPLYGNPAAVVFDADDLDTKTMQKIAQETNLSETVFFVNPTDPNAADYKVRIFTPSSELPFAGHPTIAAAHSIVDRFPQKFSNSTLLKQECGIGIVPIEIETTLATGQGQEESGRLFRMTQGDPKFTSTSVSVDTLAAMLGCSASDICTDTPFEVVSTGIPWFIVQIKTLAAISSVRPDHALITKVCQEINATGITVFTDMKDTSTSAARIHVRTFAPGQGVYEDPVCGSGNGCVCAYVAKNLHPNNSSGSYQSEQGIEMGRDGEIHASWERTGDKLKIKIAGKAVTAISGQLLV